LEDPREQEFRQEKEEAQSIAMRQGRKKEKITEKKVEIDEELRRIAEKNLRRDRELLERLAKI
jgi:hypothetical protein